MRLISMLVAVLAIMSACMGVASGQGPTEAAKPKFDADLARSVGADELGMRSYVLVILKSGPSRIPAGPERDEMFKGHFANLNRLSAEGTLVLAGPLDGVDGWRGLFVLAVADVDQARKHVATDPREDCEEDSPVPLTSRSADARIARGSRLRRCIKSAAREIR